LYPLFVSLSSKIGCNVADSASAADRIIVRVLCHRAS